MAHTSTIISPQKTFVSAITVTEGCRFTSADKRISAASTNLSNLSPRDLITISGTSNNNGNFTVASVNNDGSYITVEETIVDELSDGSTDTVLTYTGFVTDKFKGDGYYSKSDGTHTVTYHIHSSLYGKIIMQGSLASSPTENDWFDIDSTAFTADQNTATDAHTFTGNFVWIRAKVYDVTAGDITKILYNN